MAQSTVLHRFRLGFWFAFSLLVGLLGVLALAQPAQAAAHAQLAATATLQVTTNNPAVNADGQCSLIEAIVNANADATVYADCPAGNGADVIGLLDDGVLIFAAVDNNTDGNNALPAIIDDLTLLGNGATLVRNAGGATPDFRFFHVAPGVALTLVELNLRQGSVDAAGTNQLILGGGAILNRGVLTVVDSNLAFNRAGYGGAIYHAAITGTMTLTNTTFTSNRANFFGGAIYSEGPTTVRGGLLRFNQAVTSGGAIWHSSSSLTVVNATLRDNSTAGVGAGLAAYATLTDSTVLLQNTNVISNVAALNGGGIVNSASGGFVATMRVVDSHILLNRALSTTVGNGYGGGIVNGWLLPNSAGRADLTVRGSTLADNVAQSGGGIANLDVQGYLTRTASLTLVQSTLARNGATGVGAGQGSGGGLLNQNGAATVGNSTLSANYAAGSDPTTGGRGGAIGSSSTGLTTTLQVVNTTIALNRAGQAGGGIALVALVTGTAPALTLGNTLIQGNLLTSTVPLTPTLIVSGTAGCSTFDGVVTSLGHNIEAGDSCGLVASGDQKNTVVTLGPLGNNGGSTSTHLIAGPGPAFNAGSNALCAAAPVDNVDQRGVARPQGSTCDVGAVELAPGVLVYRMPILFSQPSQILPENPTSR